MKWFRKRQTTPATGERLTVRVGDDTWFTLADPQIQAYRWLHTYFSRDIEQQVIGLTSALRGEGVTYVSRRLAAVLALDTGEPTVLVDMTLPVTEPPPEAVRLDESLAESGVGQVVEPPSEKALDHDALSDELEEGDHKAGNENRVALGAGQVLTGLVDLDEVLQGTSLPHLRWLPAGGPVDHPATLLRSMALPALLDALADRFVHVVLDLPPLLADPNAIVLCEWCDGLLWVVRAGVTPIPTVKRAMGLAPRDEVLGVVLNGSNLRTPRWLLRLLGF